MLQGSTVAFAMAKAPAQEKTIASEEVNGETDSGSGLEEPEAAGGEAARPKSDTEAETDNDTDQQSPEGEEAGQAPETDTPEGELSDDSSKNQAQKNDDAVVPKGKQQLRGPILMAAGTPDVIGMSERGIVVNMFDYGPASIDGSWASTTSGQNETGINSGKTLKFFHNGLETGAANAFPRAQDYNNWTGSPNYTSGKGAAANQGIVENTLTGGYPKLAVGGGDSLNYLFDPNTSESNRTDYLGVDGLLYKIDGSTSSYKVGYRCLDYYARLNNDNEFELSDAYELEGGEASGPIGFYPFTNPDPSKKSVEGNSYYNHHFGMTMAAEFAITDSGQLGGEDMTFEFSGDDDMWVFIDGVLVLDIGGIHQPVSGKINFKDGTVTMQKAPIYDGNHAGAQNMSEVQNVLTGERKQASDGKNSYYYDTNGNLQLVQNDNMTLSHIFEMAGETWDDTPYKKHTIQAFYLERGGMYSNLDISMNLLTTKDIEVEKELIDKQGNKIADADLADYYAEADDTYDYKVNVQKESGSGYFTYTGQTNQAQQVYAFGGYDVYEDGDKMEDSAKPAFSADGVISLKKNQKLVIHGIPFDYKYTVEEVNVDQEKFSDTKVGTKTLAKDESDGKYSVQTDVLTPDSTERTTFSNVAIKKQLPHKNEVTPDKGNDEKIPDPSDATKTIDNPEGQLCAVSAGDTITYEISYSNPADKTSAVKITDALDENVEFVEADHNGAYDEQTHTVTWNFDAPKNSSGTVQLKVKVKDSAKGKKVSNQASVKVGNYDEEQTETVTNPVPDPHKNETAPYEGSGTLGVVEAGSSITYQIAYKNYKNQKANVVIEDELDPNVEFVSATNGGTLSNGVVTWNLADVAANTEGTVSLTVKVKDSAKAEGKVVNSATVKVGNDSAYDTEEVKNPVPDPHKKEISPFVGDGNLGPVDAGDSVKYQISYKNYKDEAAEVKITDVLDENVEFVSATGGGVNNNGTVSWSIPNVPAGGTGTVELTVKVKDSAKGKEIENQAAVQVGNDPSFDTETVNNPVPDPHKKEVSPYQGAGELGGLKPGDEVEYEISYKNYQKETADVVITDTLDSNVEFVEASDGGTLDGGTVTWTLTDVDAGADGTVTLKVKVKDSAKAAGKIENQASVKVGNDKAFDTETVKNPVPEDPVKEETMPYTGTGELGAVKPNTEITYSVSYKNYKTTNADVTITDKLDENVEFVEASNDGSYDEASHTVTWTIPTAAGTSGSVQLTVKVKEDAKAVGKVQNSAVVKVGNDQDFDTNIVENPVPDGPHKKETSPAEGTGLLDGVAVGEQITYSITYKNYKSVKADVTITDPLDPNVTFIEASNDGAEDGDGNVVWTIKDVPAGEEGEVTLTVQVKPGAQGKLINNVASAKVGNDPEFNTETVTNPTITDPVKAEPDPGNTLAVKVGDTITYEIGYENYRPEAATVTVTDKLDPNVEYVEDSADNNGVYDADTHTITWTIPDVPAMEEGSTANAGKVSFKVTVKASAMKSEDGPGKVENQASVKVGNDREVDTTKTENPVPDKPVKEETDPGADQAVKVGDTIDYTITYENYRDVPTKVVITDPLDAGVDFVSAEPEAAASYDEGTHTVTWTIDNAQPGEGTVSLKVEVNASAKSGDYNVSNFARVKVGNDKEFITDIINNPVPEDPMKRETSPYEGTGIGSGDSNVEELGAVKVGDTVTYTINYKNYKTKAATVTIVDTLDPNVAFAEASNGGTEADGVVTWTIPDVGPGASGTVTLKVTVLATAKESESGPGKISNQASVKVDNDQEFDTNISENPVPEDPEKTETDPYEGSGELGGVKPGQEITYKISYKNYKSTAADIVIKDTLDPNVEVVSSDPEGSKDGQSFIWTVKNVPAGKEGTVTLKVKVLDSALDVGKVVNSANVKVGNDTDYDTETVTNPVTEGPHKNETTPYEGNGELGWVKAGDQITYEISYKNYKSTAADVTVKDTLDDNVTYVSSDPEGSILPLVGKTVTWKISDVPAGESGKITLTVEVKKDALLSEGGPGKVSNTAKVQIGNDAEFETETVTNPVPDDPEKTEMSPYEGKGECGGVKPGEPITYQIKYRNYRSTKSDVTITDKLDSKVEFEEASDDGSLEDGTVTWTISGVEPGAEGYVTLTVKVKEDAEKGTIIANQADVQVANDNIMKTNEITNPLPEDPHKKETSPGEGTGLLDGVEAGDQISYSITYKNYKSVKADVTITDPLDPNVVFIDASNGGAEDGEGNVVWTIKDVAAGEEGEVTLTVQVKDGVKGELINNQASVKVGNDADYLTETVTNPTTTDPVKAEPKPGDDVAVRAGDIIEYQISYNNYRPEVADVVVTDELDPNVEFVEADNDGEYDEESHTITWTFKDVPKYKDEGCGGVVSFKVKVKESAMKSADGPGEVRNQAAVKVGNDKTIKTNWMRNPVPEDPVKEETSPGEDVGVKVGDKVKYTISYENYKLTPADVTVTDKLDPNVRFVSASEPGEEQDGTVTWVLKDVPAGKTGKVSLEVVVIGSAKQAGKIANTANVQVGNDPTYHTGIIENPVPDDPHKKEVSPYKGAGKLGKVHPGDKITYEISFRNYKKTDSDVVVKDTLDPNVTFVSASDGGTCSNGTVTWKLSQVAAGEKGSVRVTVKVKNQKSIKQVSNQASVQVGDDPSFDTETVTNPVKPKKKPAGKNPRTGDDNTLFLALVLMIQSGLLMLFLLLYRRRKQA